MNLNINYYNILEISKDATFSKIKSKYFELSKLHHPDKGGDSEKFSMLVDGYNIFKDEKKRKEYDTYSVYGNCYDETASLYKSDININNYRKNDLNIFIDIDETFNGIIEYERYIRCSGCNGNGYVADEQELEGMNECYFCFGEGVKDEKECYFCDGGGKILNIICNTCLSSRRILAKEKIEGIEFDFTKEYLIIDDKGHHSAIAKNYGKLYLIKKVET